MLFQNCIKADLLLTETTGEILQTTIQLYTVKMSHWYQMNPKVWLFNTALSAQLPCLAGLSLYNVQFNQIFDCLASQSSDYDYGTKLF